MCNLRLSQWCWRFQVFWDVLPCRLVNRHKSTRHKYFTQFTLCVFNTQTEEKQTYLLTPWCRVLLEKLTGLQLVEKFPAFHGTRRFITALTSVRHLSLSWAIPIQSLYTHPTFWRSILILSAHLRLGLPSGLPNTLRNSHQQTKLKRFSR